MPMLSFYRIETERFLESSGYAKTRKLENQETGSTETSPSVAVSEESNDVGEESVDIDEPRTLSGILSYYSV